jgi:hypothetical protein
MSFMLSAASAGEKKNAVKPGYKEWNAVVYVRVTGSWIPQRVIIRGEQVNSASPLTIVQNDALHRTGATSIAGMLSLDPNITRNARTH